MSRRVARLLAALPLAVGMSTFGTWVAGGHAPSAPACAAAAYTSRVSLVIEHGNGQVIRLCIGFDGASISGEQILKASGVEYATAGYGSLGDAVCQVDHEPPSYPPGCWTSSSPYWAMFVSRRGSGWTGADHGISSETYVDGDAEGFRYDPQTGAEPPPTSPAGTCPTVAPAGSTAVATTAPANAGVGGPSESASPGRLPASAAPRSMPPSPAGHPAAPAAGVVASSPSLSQLPGPSGSTGATPTAGVQPAFIVASVAAGALLGLVAVQLLLRRRRS